MIYVSDGVSRGALYKYIYLINERLPIVNSELAVSISINYTIGIHMKI